jgi:hypothetical protein
MVGPILNRKQTGGKMYQVIIFYPWQEDGGLYYNIMQAIDRCAELRKFGFKAKVLKVIDDN